MSKFAIGTYSGHQPRLGIWALVNARIVARVVKTTLPYMLFLVSALKSVRCFFFIYIKEVECRSVDRASIPFPSSSAPPPLQPLPSLPLTDVLTFLRYSSRTPRNSGQSTRRANRRDDGRLLVNDVGTDLLPINIELAPMSALPTKKKKKKNNKKRKLHYAIPPTTVLSALTLGTTARFHEFLSSNGSKPMSVWSRAEPRNLAPDGWRIVRAIARVYR